MDLPFRRMITQSRWPKFLAWKHPEVASNCKTVFYFDVSSRPCKKFPVNIETFGSDTFQKFDKLVPEVISSESGVAAHRHSRPSITEEFKAILHSKKDIQKNVNASLAWMHSQEDFDDDAQIYRLTYFLYDPLNQEFRDAMEFFWQRYSQEKDSWRDQPLMAYTFHHFHIKPIHMDALLPCFGKKGHKGHTYTEKDDLKKVERQ